MANTITNALTVFGGAEELQDFVEIAAYEVEWPDGTKADFPISLRKIAPLPDVPDCGPATWKESLRYCWGCERDIVEFGEVVGGEIKEWGDETYRADYHFYSPWNPPIRALLTASKRFPNLEFHLDYIDRTGWTMGGKVEITDGQFVDDQISPHITYIFDMGSEASRRYGEWAAKTFPEDVLSNVNITDADSLLNVLQSATHFHLLEEMSTTIVRRKYEDDGPNELLEELKVKGQSEGEDNHA